MKKTKIPRHPFHLVDASPWPILASLSLFGLTIGATLTMHYYKSGLLTLLLSFFFLITILGFWWRDVIRESTGEGHHTSYVQRGIRLGMVLFIVSEVMFFFAFFWAFFHSALSPSIEIGCIWPPRGINVFNPYKIPLLNTLVLLLSGATITWAHYAIVTGNHEETTTSLWITIALAVFFTTLQLAEYYEATFRISDGIYGSVFYMTTGFHGFHVIIGTTFIAVCLYRVYKCHFTKYHHVGFECAAWYWHFVDVVWLLLYLAVYCWGNSKIDVYI